MSLMLYFHRTVFACVLMGAFLIGAVNEGRKQMLHEFYSPDQLIRLSLPQLADLRVT